MDILDGIKDALGMDDDPEEFAGETSGEQEVFVEAVVTTAEGEGDMLETVHASQSAFEHLVNKIPGYAGYKAKELRREADKLLRMEVANKFDDQRKRLAELQHQLISQAQIEFLDDLERAVMKLQLLIDRIKTASYGYAGLFDAVKVKEEQLDALYDFDNQMLNFVDEVAADVDQVSSAIAAKEGIGEATTALVSTVTEANLAFGHREEAILQAAM
jgi:vacuolar-type H+-ATPase subunit H